MISQTARRYSRVAMILHWLIALLIVLNFIAIWVAEDMPKPQRMQIMANHKAIGITVLILTVVRIFWRVTRRPPPFQRTQQPWERALAHAVHALFYFAMIGIPLTGWSMVSGGGPVSLFGLFSVPPLPVPTSEAASGTFFSVHEKLAWLMIALFVLHVLGALKHQFVDRDRTLGRMIPFLRAPRG
ncbi:cytochrome b [Novosphingobium sp. 9U]|uniref:cytochrome b n=1 Tax=Novosphingobium sp. 9U TaxID=2653158 RepID=UPI0012F3F048|nr:cytochrome b [Novosphingobium sp. 9U]VWX52340.1 putative Cytochrome b561 homolog 2 [Novosphingobium sp. 9U]